MLPTSGTNTTLGVLIAIRGNKSQAVGDTDRRLSSHHDRVLGRQKAAWYV
jgi:hypothetical protein